MKTKPTSSAVFFNLRLLVGFVLCSLGLVIGLGGLSKAVTGTSAATPAANTHHRHHHYKLIDLGTLGGPQSFGDGGHSAGNINNRGVAVGVADTTTPDPYYPNYNPLGFFPDPFVHHAFQTSNGVLIDLGALPGANSSSLGWITENGLVAGQSLNGSIDPLTGWPEQNAVLWKHGQIINLGTLGGYESGAVQGSINSHGQIVGFSGNAIPDPNSLLGLGTQTRAFLWDEKNGMQDLGTLGGTDAFAPLINERGQVTGFSYVNSNPSSNCFAPLTTHPFLWERGTMYDIGLGGSCGGTDGINNKGQVVGFSNVTGDTEAHAFLWDNAKAIDIGTLGGTYGEAFCINEAGEAAGLSTTAGDQEVHAFLWNHGVLKDLGPLPNYDSTCVGAFGINSRGQIVGQAVENFCVGSGAHAFLWQDGEMIDLNDFVPPGSDLTLVDVEKINDRGEMFGMATLPDGDDRAFLLIPCDENHPGLEGCDYSLVEAPAAVAQPSAAIRGVTNHTLPPSLLHRISRYHFPGRAFGLKD